MENSMEVSQKLKIELSYDPAILLLGVYLEKMKTLTWKAISTPCIHCSIIYGIQDMEAT